MARHDESRRIIERIHISGMLVLQSPAHFGNGAVRGDALTDMTLLLDDAEPTVRALIPGTTIAGALRSYLGERLRGYNVAERMRSAVSDLFGPWRENPDETAEQSLLIVEDALATTHTITLRDGVRIDERTGTAYQDDTGGAKYDVELLEAGAAFDLHFELLITQAKPATQIIPALLAALGGLEQGEIHLGLRKRRGYGRCQVKAWRVSRYQLQKPADLCAWLETAPLAHQPMAAYGTLAEAFAAAFPAQPELQAEVADARRQFSVTALFGLEKSSLLIRSGFGEADLGPDFVHLTAKDENGQVRATIPGTSWAGVVRHRALRIANTLGVETAQNNVSQMVVKELFGHVPSTALQAVEKRAEGKAATGEASRAQLDETYVHHGQSLYQTRVRIDRFTGGAYERALFEEAPVYGTDKTRIGFHLHVRNPQDYEIGLLLLVLKDLWTGDLPIGGEVAVGRGRLTGIEATLVLPGEKEQAPQTLKLDSNQANLGLDDAQRTQLQEYVDALWTKLNKAGNHEQR